MEAILSSETSAHTRFTRCHITEDGIVQYSSDFMKLTHEVEGIGPYQFRGLLHGFHLVTLVSNSSALNTGLSGTCQKLRDTSIAADFKHRLLRYG
jgi:hypothetical protein